MGDRPATAALITSPQWARTELETSFTHIEDKLDNRCVRDLERNVTGSYRSLDTTETTRQKQVQLVLSSMCKARLATVLVLVIVITGGFVLAALPGGVR
ncbi:MAG: hypothetical protein WCB79_01615, partial [Halobacteriota archaeon]